MLATHTCDQKSSSILTMQVLLSSQAAIFAANKTNVQRCMPIYTQVIADFFRHSNLELNVRRRSKL